MAEIERRFGWRPFPGTLNLRVADLSNATLRLGEPEALTEHSSRIGPLRWWPVVLSGAYSGPALVVRGQKSTAPYLEIVAPVRLREHVADGDALTVELVA
jgi:CTP-dependent riboflavin kinase